MKFGICTSHTNAAAVKAAGADYIEESVQAYLQGKLPDAEWKGRELRVGSLLPIPSANMLVPADLKITGPDVKTDALRQYMSNVLRRASSIDMRTLVFGSGGARNIPEGFDRGRAKQQIIDFLKMSGPVAAQHGVTIVVEPLNRGECNVINTVAEAMEYVRAADHPNVRCLVDSFHLWLEDEPLENVREAMPWIAHVHVADKVGRTAPGESGQSDYRPLFAILKQAKYDRLCSIEASKFEDIEGVGRRAIEFLKKQWSEA